MSSPAIDVRTSQSKGTSRCSTSQSRSTMGGVAFAPGAASACHAAHRPHFEAIDRARQLAADVGVGVSDDTGLRSM